VPPPARAGRRRRDGAGRASVGVGAARGGGVRGGRGPAVQVDVMPLVPQ